MINVFYSGNKKVFDMIMISAYSMSKTASRPLNIFIVTMDLSDENPKYIPITLNQANFLDELLKKKNPNNKVTLLDVTNIYKAHRFDSPNNLDLFTPYALLRIFADYFDLPSKIIYFDVDTIINNDIAELFDQDVEDFEIGCVRDVFILGQKLNKTYFNSGMLLMNMNKIKETGYLHKTRLMCQNKKMLFLDQTALNLTVTYKKMLDRKFNCIHVPRKKYENIVVHHMCDCRAYLVKRYKSSDFKMVKKHMPFYTPLIEEIEEIKKISDNL